MDKNANISGKILVNLTRNDYMLLKRSNKQELADFQGEMVDYAIWCQIMNYINKIKKRSKTKFYGTGFVAEEVIALN